MAKTDRHHCHAVEDRIATRTTIVQQKANHSEGSCNKSTIEAPILRKHESVQPRSSDTCPVARCRLTQISQVDVTDSRHGPLVGVRDDSWTKLVGKLSFPRIRSPCVSKSATPFLAPDGCCTSGRSVSSARQILAAGAVVFDSLPFAIYLAGLSWLPP